MGRSRSRSRSRDRDRGRDRSHSSSSSSSEDSAEREERMQRERDDREGGGAPRRSGGLGRYLALSGAIWRYLALSGYLILSHSISCRSDKRIGQTRPIITLLHCVQKPFDDGPLRVRPLYNSSCACARGSTTWRRRGSLVGCTRLLALRAPR